MTAKSETKLTFRVRCNDMRTYLTKNQLAVRLRVCPATLSRRLASAKVEPDACLMLGAGKCEAHLFDTEHLPALREKLLHTAPEVIA